jgi:hypothetical protein
MPECTSTSESSAISSVHVWLLLQILSLVPCNLSSQLRAQNSELAQVSSDHDRDPKLHSVIHRKV